MEICILADALAAAAASQGLGFDKFVLPRKAFSSKSNRRPTYSGGSGVLQISEVLFPIIDAVATPPVRSKPYRISRRMLHCKRRRTGRRSSAGGSDDDGGGGEAGFFGDGGGDGPFGGSGAGAGGGWNFDGFGGSDWDDSSSSSDHAFDFFYEVLSWIALSNCVHFAFKRVLGIVAEDGAVGGDGSKEKFPMRLTPVC